ncbi:MAG: CvpA family protein [Alphaproteobacteria bacterium]|nr:MAG: CvpA family protein [Alphaproteobacteria bacterium]
MPGGWTAFDVIVLLIIGGSVLHAVFRGFTTMVLTVLSWLAAILVTLYAMGPVSALAGRLIEPPALASFIALPVLFIASLMVFKAIANSLGRRMRTGPVGLLDRSLGAALGLGLGMLLVSAGYLFFAGIVPERHHPDWVKTASLRPLVAYGATMLAKTGPQLFARIGETPSGEALVESMKRNYDAGKKKVETIRDVGYDAAARRLMEEAVKAAEKETPPPNSSDDGGGD